MPTKATTLRNIRVADPLWSEAQAVAERRGENLSEIIRQYLAAHVEAHRHE